MKKKKKKKLLLLLCALLAVGRLHIVCFYINYDCCIAIAHEEYKDYKYFEPANDSAAAAAQTDVERRRWMATHTGRLFSNFHQSPATLASPLTEVVPGP